MRTRLRLFVCVVLVGVMTLGGCSTVVVRTKGEGETVGTKHKINHSAFILGATNNPVKFAFSLTSTVTGKRLAGRRWLNKAGAKRGFHRDYAFSKVMIESTVGDWFLRILTFGLYWPSTVTVWVVE